MKKRLYTPGPTPVPESVMLKMAEPIIHHRHKEFTDVFARVNQNLKYLFQTSEDVYTLTSSGTGAMEAAVCNLHRAGDTALFVNGGKFGERWGELLQAYGVTPVDIVVEWGTAVAPEAILNALKANPKISAVYLTHSETSTGTATDVKTLASLIHQHSNVVVVIDGITAVGAMELRMDEWGIDVVVTGSQKGLMVPPGLAFIALSKRAWEMVNRSNLPNYYFNLKKAQKAMATSDTPWTPAISLIIGVDAALEMIRQTGVEHVWARHDRLARSIRVGVEAIGLKLLSNVPSNALTAVYVPESVDAKKFNKVLKNNYGITIAGGQGHLTGKIFRISHLGYYDELDMITMISALEMTLQECGFEFELGSGLRAAQATFIQSPSVISA
ncbi:MAG: alanine--glyoxylate aminotransferase family protein [Ignavibacteriales bacterium]|nr:alanine--glyoxylate aminotransferase family protein [Ignavibacteriales bacterium]